MGCAGELWGKAQTYAKPGSNPTQLFLHSPKRKLGFIGTFKNITFPDEEDGLEHVLTTQPSPSALYTFISLPVPSFPQTSVDVAVLKTMAWPRKYRQVLW